MHITKLVIVVFAVILYVFGVISLRVSNTSSRTAGVVTKPQTSNVLIADGTDPVPRPWHHLAA